MVDVAIKKNRINVKSALMAVSVAALVGVGWWLSGVDYTTPRVSLADVRIVTPVKGDLSIDILGSGRIKASRSHIIAAREAGDVRQTFSRPGAFLTAGTTIAELTSVSLHDEVRQSRADLEAQQRVVTIAELELRESRAQYVDRVSQSQGDYETAKAVLQANDELMSLPSPPISRLEYERSRREYRMASERYRGAQANLSNYDDIERERVQQFRLELSSLQGDVSRLVKRLEDLEIVMPEDGVLQELLIENGQRVNAGDQVAVVYARGQYHLELEVPALRAGRLTVGSSAVVTLAGEEYSGQVTRIDPQVRGAQVLVDVSFEHPEPERIQVNMFANARISVGERIDVFSIPTPQGVNEFGTASLYIIDPLNTRYADYKPVNFGAMSSSRIEVVSGVAVDDQLIISDISRSVQGAERVKIR